MFRFTMSALMLSAVSLSAQSHSLGLFFTQTNDSSNNQVLVGASMGGKTLEIGRHATGGKGTSAGLGSQGALAMERRYLLAVNAGSNSVSLFVRYGLVRMWLSDVAGTGGKRPTSVDIRRNLVYVLNADSDDLTGFRIHGGKLHKIGSFPLSGKGVGGSQVGFDPTGRYLVVTERAVDRILVYPVHRNGSLGKPTINKSAAPTPFGFQFGRHRTLVVSEAAGGAAGKSAASSYRILPRSGGKLAVLTSALATMQTAACWVGATRNGRFAYTANTPSSNLTGFSIDAGGKLHLLNANGITAQLDSRARPFDLQFNVSGHLLFVLDSGLDEVIAFYRDHKGGLHRMPGSVKLPDNSAGLIAR